MILGGAEKIEKKIWGPSPGKKIEGLPAGQKIKKAFCRKKIGEATARKKQIISEFSSGPPRSTL